MSDLLNEAASGIWKGRYSFKSLGGHFIHPLGKTPQLNFIQLLGMHAMTVTVSPCGTPQMRDDTALHQNTSPPPKNNK